MALDPQTHLPDASGGGERGAAIIIALMVSLVLAFLGLGLLLQTSLGRQAAGTDRWGVRALYAASQAGEDPETIENYFYPFVRAELKIHDPVGHAAVEQAWGLAK